MMINVESRPELHRVSEVAQRMQLQAPVSLRVNPDLDPGTHPHISTGHRDTKFGIPLSQVREYYAEARGLRISIGGLSTHIGSQITETAPFAEAGGKIAKIVSGLARTGHRAQVSRPRRRARNSLPGRASLAAQVLRGAARAAA